MMNFIVNVMDIILIVCLVIAIKKMIEYLKIKIKKEQMNYLSAWVEVSVKAAEQLCNSGKIQKDDRKEHVLDFVKSMGFDTKRIEIHELIESCVNDLPKGIKENPDEEELNKVYNEAVEIVDEAKKE